MTTIASLNDLCFVFGPSTGYNREVLLWDASQWRVPNRMLVDELFRTTGFADKVAPEFRDFGERPTTPEHRAAWSHLWCAVLTAPDLRDLEVRMAQHEVSMFRFSTHREIVQKASLYDWLTVGTLLFTFEHLDR